METSQCERRERVLATYDPEALIHTMLQHLPVLLEFVHFLKTSLVLTRIPRVEIASHLFVCCVHFRHIDATIAIGHLLVAIHIITLTSNAERLT